MLTLKEWHHKLLRSCMCCHVSCAGMAKQKNRWTSVCGKVTSLVNRKSFCLFLDAGTWDLSVVSSRRYCISITRCVNPEARYHTYHVIMCFAALDHTLERLQFMANAMLSFCVTICWPNHQSEMIFHTLRQTSQREQGMTGHRSVCIGHNLWYWHRTNSQRWKLLFVWYQSQVWPKMVSTFVTGSEKLPYNNKCCLILLL